MLFHLKKKNINRMVATVFSSVILAMGIKVDVQASAGEIMVNYHTKKEIVDFFEANPVKNLETTYEVEPSITAPYEAGKIKQEVLDDALATMNRIRFIAGLYSDLELYDVYSKNSQDGALVSAVNSSTSNYQQRPDDMDNDLFSSGSTGCSMAILAKGYDTLSSCIIEGWVCDSQNVLSGDVWQRRWVLNPALRRVGFGDVCGRNGIHYMLANMFDYATQVPANAWELTVWPGQNTPVEYFVDNSAWSYSSGKEEDENVVVVTLLNKTQNKEWHFSKESADGKFKVDNGSYGLTGCVIFQPSDQESYNPGDTYKVTITGLKDGDVSYHVNFFSMEKPYQVAYSANGGSGTMITAEGLANKEEFVLPECSFQAPEGKEFAGWYVEGSVKQPGEKITMVNDVTVKATWRAKDSEGEEFVLINSAFASFEGKIGVVFRMELPDYVKDDAGAYAIFTMNGKEFKTMVSQALPEEADGKTVYRFTKYVVAKEYRDNVNIKLFDGNDNPVTVKGKSGMDYTTTGVDYSLQTYVSKKKDSNDQKMAALAIALEDYCTAAQIYFNYNATGLVASDRVKTVTLDQLEGYKGVFDGTMPAGLSGRSISVAFESDNAFKMFYTYDGSVKPKDYVYAIDGNPATLYEEDGKYFLMTANVAAKNLDKVYTYTITKGDATYTVKCSVLTYARSSVNNGTEARKDLGRSLYLYNQAAKAYFED